VRDGLGSRHRTYAEEDVTKWASTNRLGSLASDPRDSLPCARRVNSGVLEILRHQYLLPATFSRRAVIPPICRRAEQLQSSRGPAPAGMRRRKCRPQLLPDMGSTASSLHRALRREITGREHGSWLEKARGHVALRGQTGIRLRKPDRAWRQ